MSNPNSPSFGDNAPVPFENLLRLLDHDRNLAGEKYERLRRKLIKFFEWNLCSPAEDLADETLERLEQKIGQTEIQDVDGFAWGIAKNIRQEARKQAARTVPIADMQAGQTELPARQFSDDAMGEKLDQERRAMCFRLCLQRMSPPDRELFLAYHSVQGSHLVYRRELADRLGLSINNLRVRINRLRDQLEKCSRRCFASRQSGKSR